MVDFYEILQVHPKADPDVIRAAYRVLARKHHPDHGGDPGRMIQINDAWDVLGDAARRAEYDALRAVSSRYTAPATGSPPAAASWAGGASPAGGASSAGGAPSAGRASSAAPRADSFHAGPPPGRPSGTVLDFGRYAGWSLGEIARRDRDYLEWLLRATVARKLRGEVEALLRSNRR